MDGELSDEGVLAMLVTAWLIRDGGKTMFTGVEVIQAIEDRSTLFVHRDEETGQMEVMLVPAKAARA